MEIHVGYKKIHSGIVQLGDMVEIKGKFEWAAATNSIGKPISLFNCVVRRKEKVRPMFMQIARVRNNN